MCALPGLVRFPRAREPRFWQGGYLLELAVPPRPQGHAWARLLEYNRNQGPLGDQKVDPLDRS